MSWGLICACNDSGHPFDARSEHGHSGIWCRCRNYARDELEGGLCAACEAAGHSVAPVAERDHQQQPWIAAASADAWVEALRTADKAHQPLQLRPGDDERHGRPLGKRELQVLALLAGGKTNKQIAAALRLSSNTVKYYRAMALAKLGADSTPHAVAIAMRLGLITTAGSES